MENEDKIRIVKRLGKLPAKDFYHQEREDLRTQLVKKIADNHTVTLTGPKGIGKTSLALAFAYDQMENRVQTDKKYDLVIWVNCENFEEACSEIEKELTNEQIESRVETDKKYDVFIKINGEKSEVERREIEKELPIKTIEFYSYLAEYNGQWLLILDNATAGKPEKLPSAPKGDIILTSREFFWPHLMQVPHFKPNESQQLITRILSADVKNPETEEQIIRIANELDHYPQVIADAMKAHVDTNAPLKDYYHDLMKQNTVIFPTKIAKGEFFQEINEILEMLAADQEDSYSYSLLGSLVHMSSVFIPREFIQELIKKLYPYMLDDNNDKKIYDITNTVLSKLRKLGILEMMLHNDDVCIIALPVLEVLRFHFSQKMPKEYMNILMITVDLLGEQLKKLYGSKDTALQFYYMHSKIIIDRIIGLAAVDAKQSKDEDVDYDKRSHPTFIVENCRCLLENIPSKISSFPLTMISGETTWSTKGGGDCPFHAMLGRRNVSEKKFICDNVIERRKQVAEAIKKCAPGEPLFLLAQEAIKDIAMNRNRQITSKHLKALQVDYQQYEKNSDEQIASAWKNFAKELQKYPAVNEYIDLFIKGHCKEKNISLATVSSLKEKFFTCLNEDEGFKGILFSLPQLDQAHKIYKQQARQNFDWDERLSKPEIMEEYAHFIAKPRQWLLPLELNILAIVFNLKVELYTQTLLHRNTKPVKLETYNSGEKKTVAICFNGVDHYEQMTNYNTPEQSNFESKTGNKKSKDQIPYETLLVLNSPKFDQERLHSFDHKASNENLIRMLDFMTTFVRELNSYDELDAAYFYVSIVQSILEAGYKKIISQEKCLETVELRKTITENWENHKQIFNLYQRVLFFKSATLLRRTLEFNSHLFNTAFKLINASSHLLMALLAKISANPNEKNEYEQLKERFFSEQCLWFYGYLKTLSYKEAPDIVASAISAWENTIKLDLENKILECSGLPNFSTCDLLVMSSLPSHPKNYLNSYIVIRPKQVPLFNKMFNNQGKLSVEVATLLFNKLDEKTRVRVRRVNKEWQEFGKYDSGIYTLYYIDWNGKPKRTPIVDTAKFKQDFETIVGDDKRKKLTYEQVKDLITSNGGHIPTFNLPEPIRLENISTDVVFRYGAVLASAKKHKEKHDRYPYYRYLELKKLLQPKTLQTDILTGATSADLVQELLIKDMFDEHEESYELDKIVSLLLGWQEGTSSGLLAVVSLRVGWGKNSSVLVTSDEKERKIKEECEKLTEDFRLLKQNLRLQHPKLSREILEKSELQNIIKRLSSLLSLSPDFKVKPPLERPPYNEAITCLEECLDFYKKNIQKTTSSYRLIFTYRKLGKYYLLRYTTYKENNHTNRKDLEETLEMSWSYYTKAFGIYRNHNYRDEPTLETMSIFLGFLEVSLYFKQENIPLNDWNNDLQGDYFLRCRFILSQLYNNTFRYARKLFKIWQQLDPQYQLVSATNKNIFDIKVSPSQTYYQKELKNVEDNLKAKPQNIWLRFSRANAMVNLGQYSEGINEFNYFLLFYPYSSTALARMGYAAYKLELYPAARVYFEYAQAYHGNRDSLLRRNKIDCQQALVAKTNRLGTIIPETSKEGRFIASLKSQFALLLQQNYEKSTGEDARMPTGELATRILKAASKLIPKSAEVMGVAADLPFGEFVSDTADTYKEKKERDAKYKFDKVKRVAEKTKLIPEEIDRSQIFNNIARELVTSFQKYFYYLDYKGVKIFANYLSESMINYLGSDRLIPYYPIEKQLMIGATEGRTSKLGKTFLHVRTKGERKEEFERDVSNAEGQIKHSIPHKISTFFYDIPEKIGETWYRHLLWTPQKIVTQSNISTPDDELFISPEHTKKYLTRTTTEDEARTLGYNPKR